MHLGTSDMSSGSVRRVSREDIQLVSWSWALPCSTYFLFYFILFFDFYFINENECLDIQFYLHKIVSLRLGVIQMNMFVYGESDFYVVFFRKDYSLFVFYFNLMGKG